MQQEPQKSMLRATPKETQLSSQTLRHFTPDEIQSAIHIFNEAAIGRGGFGEVFKGCIKDGPTTVVAIKRCKSTSDHLTPQFWAEVDMLSTLRHRNLVSLIGYCKEEKEMALVYEYMPNGTLADHLHKDGARLSWLQLLKICIGAAQGLDFLHTRSGTKLSIIHRDVKSTNILLDTNFVAKISDFGIAKEGPTNETSTHVSTDVKGTFGYLDPSYHGTRHLRTKSDVYAFGVVLLEVICGLRAIHKSRDGNSRGLAPWAKDCIKQGRLNEIIDRRLSGQIATKCGEVFAHIACDCLHENTHARPEMAAVVSRLKKVLSMQERLDSSMPEPKVFDKIMSCWRPIVESEDSNLILAGGSEGKPDDKLNNPVIDMEKGKAVLCDENAPKLNHISHSEGDQVTDAIILASNDHDHSGKGNLMAFSYDVLKTVTKNFHKDRFLGEGSFGSVYRGWIHEQSLAAAEPGTGTDVAVVKKKDNQHLQSHSEWLAEVNCLGVIDHPNLVKLIGYCADGDSKLLVYEFLERGSLGNYLFKRRFYPGPLPWNLRIKVALGAAKGLAYLHKPESKVMCQDFNSTSILIDSNDNARISNFGMVKHGQADSKSQASRQVIHTRGYADPEYITTGHFTTSSNMYSFGVVLLELLTGQRCIDKIDDSNGERILVEFARPYLMEDSEEIEKIIDRYRDEYYSSHIAQQAALIAKRCLFEESSSRPTADEVVEILEQLRLPKKCNCLPFMFKF